MERWNLDDKEYYSASYNMMAGVSGLPIIAYNNLEKRYGSFNAVWGVIPAKTASLDEAKKGAVKFVNARAETIKQRVTYNSLLQNGQRCLIPCSVYFEHHRLGDAKTSVPFAIKKADEEIFSIPGLYAVWKEPASKKLILSYTMLTTMANSTMGIIHNAGEHAARMPLAINRSLETIWLDPKANEKQLNQVLTYRITSELLQAWPIHPIRGKNARTGSDVLELDARYNYILNQVA